MRFTVELKPGEDGWVVVSCPSLPGCHSQGKTREEALVNIQEAILGWLEAEALEAGELARESGTEIAVVEVAA
jgi:predicted RNase H-like HicB family nuclease